MKEQIEELKRLMKDMIYWSLLESGEWMKIENVNLN